MKEGFNNENFDNNDVEIRPEEAELQIRRLLQMAQTGGSVDSERGDVMNILASMHSGKIAPNVALEMVQKMMESRQEYH